MKIQRLLSSDPNSSSSQGQLGSYKRQRTSPSREGGKDQSEHMHPEDFKQRLLTYSRGQLEGINDLPPGIMTDIISRLPVKSILACTLVCTKWNRVTKDPGFIKLQLTRSGPQFVLQPLLEHVEHLGLVGRVVLEGEGLVKNWQIPVTNMICRYSTVMCSYNGLLCMAPKDGKADPLCIYNPITRVFLELPRSGHKCPLSDYVVCLGCTSNGRYKIVRHYTQKDDTEDSRLEILSLGQSSWRQLSVPEPNWYPHKSVFHNGLFFILMMKKVPDRKLSIIAIDVNDESIQMIPFGEEARIHSPNLKLLVVKGRVTFLEISKRNKSTWVVSGNKVGEFFLHLEPTIHGWTCLREECLHGPIYAVEGDKWLVLTSWDHQFVMAPSSSFTDMSHCRGTHLAFSINYKMFDYKPSFVDPVADALIPWPSSRKAVEEDVQQPLAENVEASDI